MGDPFSVVASAMGCASLGLQLIELSFKIIDYAGKVKNAPEEMHALVRELKLFKSLLTRLGKFSQANPQSENVMILMRTNGPLEEYQDALQAFVKKLDSRKGSKSEAFKWPFRAGETKDQMSLLERQKSLCEFAMILDILNFTREVNDHMNYIRGSAQSLLVSNAQVNVSVEVLRVALSEDKRNSVLSWIFPDPYHKRHNEITNDRGENTGRWLLEVEEFKRWRDGSSNSRLLFGHGNPGAGKTVLSSAVIDHLRQRRETTKVGVAYFYFDYKDDTSKQTPSNVLASLVRQLIDQLPGQLPKSIVDLYEELKPTQPTELKLLTVLYDIAKSLPGVYIVFDALDECNPVSRAKFLLLFKGMAEHHINLFLTSRPHLEDVQVSLRGAGKIELVAQEVDVMVYVRQAMDRSIRISETLGLSTEYKDMIVNEIVMNSQGIFLLASFYSSLICEQTDEEEIQLCLESLKDCAIEERPLDHFYQRAMGTIGGQRKSQKQLAYKILTWLVRAKRALTVDELQVALAIKPEQYELQGKLKGREILTHVCASLVVVDQLSDTIRLAHFTAHEYLLETFQDKDLDLQFSHANFELARVCVTYLSFNTLANGPSTSNDSLERRFKDHHLLAYSANYFHQHLEDCDEDLTAAMLGRFLANPGGTNSYLQARAFPVYKCYDHYCRGKSPLHIASMLGHLAVVKLLVKDGANISVTDARGNTTLHGAAFSGNFDLVKYLIYNGADISARDCGGTTPLHNAALMGYWEVVRLLLENGADVTAAEDNGFTPLHAAAAEGHEIVVQILLKYGADPSAIKDDQDTPLHSAAFNGNEAIVRLLLDYGADTLAKDIRGSIPLHDAASSGYKAVVQLLINRDARGLLVKNDKGATPLHHAVLQGNEAVVQLFLQGGADISSEDNERRTPLHDAVIGRHETAIRMLLESGADISAADINRRTPLHDAALGGSENVVQLLLQKGANKSAIDDQGKTPLHEATISGSIVAVQFLLDYQADISAVDNDGCTPLHYAAFEGHKAVAQLLLQNGADVSATKGDGGTPLHQTTFGGHENVARVFLENGADISAKDGDGNQPLHWAALNGHVAVVQLFIESGADISAISNSGFTPLQDAALNGKIMVVQLLLSKGVDVLAVDRDGRTPLLCAAQEGHEEVAELLLQSGADVLAMDNSGITPLYNAVCGGYESLVRLLLNYGADISVMNDGGRTPFEEAIDIGNEAVAQLLCENETDLIMEDCF